MLTRLITALDAGSRTVGRYQTTDAGILIPAGNNFFIVRINRPNTLLGETAWPQLGANGKADTHQMDNGRVSGFIGGLDTEVLRVYVFISEDGVNWTLCGHVGTTGGTLVGRGGNIMLETQYRGELPVSVSPLKMQLICELRAGLSTQIVVDLDDTPRPPVLRLDSHQSIAVESTASGSATAASSVTTSGNVSPAGTGRYLVVFGASSAETVGGYTSITYGSVVQPQVFTDVYQTVYRLSCAAEIAPSTTPATVTYTISDSDDELAVGAVAFSGVDQDTPAATAPAVSSAASGNPSHTVPAGATGDVRIAGMYGTASAIAVGSGETSRVEVEGIGAGTSLGICTKEDGGSDAMDWTLTAGGPWGMRGFNVIIEGVNQRIPGSFLI